MAETPNFQIPSTDSSLSTQTERDLYIQRWVLMVLYYSTTPWIFTWRFGDTNIPTCNWNRQLASNLVGGAFCNDEHVYAIELPFNKLSGTIPSELAILTRLVWLNLNGNEIRGTIPDQFSSLTNLQLFDVLSNRLTGTFPQWLDGSFTNLQILGFSNNYIDGSLPSTFSQLTTLLSLAIDDNLITGSLSSLNSLTNLKEIFAEDNSFQSTLDTDTFANLASLVAADLSNNEIDGSLPAHFFNNQNFVNLTILDLHKNKITGTIPPIELNPTLRLLALHNNDIKGVFPPDIVNLQALTHLDLTATGFTGAIPTELGALTNLIYLFLADTSFLPGTIPDHYSNLIFLQDLSLKHTNRNGKIPTWFGNMDRLVLLDLDSNQLTGSIPTEVGNMVSLKFLLLNRNMLTGSIPTELVNLNATLQLATFDHNPITGTAEPLCLELEPKGIYMTSDCLANSTNSSADSDSAAVAAGSVSCSCCVDCCDPANTTCHSINYLAQYDPIWEDGYTRSKYIFVSHDLTPHGGRRQRELLKTIGRRKETSMTMTEKKSLRRGGGGGGERKMAAAAAAAAIHVEMKGADRNKMFWEMAERRLNDNFRLNHY